MFNEIGIRIKLIAEIYAAAMPALTLLAVVITAIRGANVLPYLFAGVPCTLLAWPMYGFGQLVQDVHDLRLGDGSMNIHGDDLPQL